MKTLSVLLITALAAGATFFGTATLFGHALKTYKAAPAAIIGAYGCGKWLGAAVITHAGQVVPEEDLTAEQTEAIAKELGDGHSALIDVPCAGQAT